MSHFDKTLWDTLPANQGEKALSTDWNHITDSMSKDLQNLFRGIFFDMIVGTATDGFIDGFDLVASNPISMVVTLKAGRGFQTDGADSSYASAYKFSRLDTDYPITISAAHATLPRIDLIQIKHAVKKTEQQSRDIYNATPGIEQFGPANVHKREIPWIEEGALYKTGTPAVQPLFPSPDAGYLAAWYVVVPAAATTIAEANLIDARHWLVPKNVNRDAHHLTGLQLGWVDSGNISVSQGFVEILGRRLGFASAQDASSPVSLGSNLEAGATEQASTWYFWYLVRPQKLHKTKYQGPQTPSEERKFLFVASTVQPDADGHPVSAITVNIFSGTVTLTETVARERCILLGSFFNDSAGNIRPFIQSGSRFFWTTQQEIFNRSAFQGIFDIDLTSFVPSGSHLCQIEIFQNAASGVSNQLTLAGGIYPILSLYTAGGEKNSEQALIFTGPDRHLEGSTLASDCGIVGFAMGYKQEGL